MKLFEGKTPAERNKLLLAIGLGVLALASISYMIISSFSGSTPKTANANANKNAASRNGELMQASSTASTTRVQSSKDVREQTEVLAPPTRVPAVYSGAAYDGPEPRRNIFVYYVPPKPPDKPAPTPTPPPPPTLILASVTPATVYARTGDFNLEVSGDKFTPATAIVVDNNPMPTRFINAQQLATTVPASMISNDGARQVVVRTPDNKEFSNPLPLIVSAPPLPNFIFIGIIGKVRYNDTAVLKDKGNPKELLNVQRGDVVGGRFRVTSISEREIVLTDTSLKIKHTLPFSDEKGAVNTGQGPGTRQGIPRAPLEASDGNIPGIPNNIPRYQPPARAEQPQDDENDDNTPDEVAPGIPAGKPKP